MGRGKATHILYHNQTALLFVCGQYRHVCIVFYSGNKSEPILLMSVRSMQGGISH